MIIRKLYANRKYVNLACARAYTIFKTLRQNDRLLRIDVYDKCDIDKVGNQLEIGKPKETVKKKYIFEEDEITHYELYWDLNETIWSIEKIAKEVVWADIGGLNSLASTVFLLYVKEHILYHLYDDRGLDVVAKDKETLRPIYEKYKDWILEYDCESPHAALPRSGADGKLLRRIGRVQPKRIVYVSCNPETFAENIVHLKEFGYELKKVQLVDMFPHTYHVEAVSLLKLTEK